MTIVIQDIPLSKLIPSKANVRRTGRTMQIGELAASIAAHGLLQNLTVRPVAADGGKTFEVIAGGRRLAALKLLAKKKAMPTNAPIPCHIVEEGISEEISLAENALQCPMHPADQYEAFAKLHHQHGMNAEDIAARFGVTPTMVKQRLKLGAVSPKLMKLYRAEDISLDQLTAFTITDDHAKQERVWNDLPQFHRSREAILRVLGEGQVESSDRRALFVGAEAYEAAGGIIIRDLFDPEGGGFFADEALVNRLAREKLEQEAEKVSAEGWKWVEVDFTSDGSATADMRRVYPNAVKLSPTEKKRLRKLQTRHDALCDKQGEDMTEKAAAQLSRLEAAIEALERYEYRPADIAKAGAIVTLGHHGDIRIERGFVLPEDEPEKKADKRKAARDGKDEADTLALSEKLVAELTAHRTAALRNELAQNPALALTAAVHAMAAVTFAPCAQVSCLGLTVRSAWLATHAPGIDEAPAGRALAERHQAWAIRLPPESDALWAFIRDLPQAEQLELLAHCLAQSLNAVQTPGHRGIEAAAHADTLASETKLDMAAYWRPTVTGYLGRVSKEHILAAVREGVSPEAAANLASMKKAAMAEAAEQRLAGTGWLPPLLRGGVSGDRAA